MAKAQYRVTLEGPETEWEWREGPDYYTKDGKRRDGVEAPKRKAPSVRIVTTEPIDSEDHAVALALERESHDGHVKVLKVEKVA